jgi:hypothetical protein
LLYQVLGSLYVRGLPGMMPEATLIEISGETPRHEGFTFRGVKMLPLRLV